MIVQCLECGHTGHTKEKNDVEVCECCEGVNHEPAEKEQPFSTPNYTQND